jgi:hypothetical protein
MLDAELLWLSDCNVGEFAREQARWLPGFQIEERDSRLLVASGTRFPAGSFNCVIPQGESAVDAPALLEHARRFFTPLDRGFSVYAPAHHGQS